MLTNWLRLAVLPVFVTGVISTAIAQEPQKEPRTLTVASFFIGLGLDELSDQLKTQLNLEHGVVIAEVVPDSPAAKAELKRHDILLKVDESDVNSPQDVQKAVGKAQGKEVQLVVLRAGKEMKFAVTPEKRSLTERVPEDGGNRLEGRFRWALPGEAKDQFFYFHPGVMMGKGALKFGDLPADLSISIHKEGKEPARLVVKKGDQTWEVADTKLADLPAEVREVVERFLAGGMPERMAIRFHAQPGAVPMPVPPIASPAEAPDAVKKAQEELAKAQEHLQEQLRKWQGERRTVTAPVPQPNPPADRKFDEVLKELRELRKEVDSLKKK